MSTNIILPKIGFSMNEGTVAEWMVGDGTEVKQGQPLYTLESEKSVQEIEAPISGKLTIIKQAGEVYDVGTVLGVIE